MQRDIGYGFTIASSTIECVLECCVSVYFDWFGFVCRTLIIYEFQHSLDDARICFFLSIDLCSVKQT